MDKLINQNGKYNTAPPPLGMRRNGTDKEN
jgi:hypothetical protein